MANTLTVNRPASARGRWLRASGIALIGVLLVLSIGGYWLLQQRQPRANPEVETNLLALIDPAQVPAQLALLALADYPAEQLWLEPLNRGQWDGALAMWLFGPVRPDALSIEQLLKMAEFQARQSPDDAAAYLLAAADLTRLSPELGDRERAELLLQIGQRMEALGLTAAAVTEWRQASVIAHFSPSLPSMYRASLLQQLARHYRQAGARRLAERARQAAGQVGSASGMLIVPERIALTTDALPEEPAELQAARARRRQAAALTAQTLEVGGSEAAYAELRAALSAEGLLHRLWITEQLKEGHPREVQAALLLYHINWLQQERMLAWGMGGDHFPTWVERRGQLDRALHEAWEALEVVRLDQTIQEQLQARVTLAQRDWWAARLVQARLLRDPLLDHERLLESMRPNNADPAGEALLRLDWIQQRFWRVPREYVGTDLLPE